MQPIYLTGERIHVRPMLPEDKAHTVAWFNSPLPVNATFGERYLKDIHESLWDVSKRQFAIVRADAGQIVGGAVVNFAARDRKASISLHAAPLLEDADEVQAEALRILARWLLDDHNMRRVDATIASEDSVTIEAARQLGMFEGVRIRQFFRRPGRRVDALIYQVLNPNQEHLYAKSDTGER